MENKTKNNPTEALEEVVDEKHQKYYYLRLYIAGRTKHSVRALENLRRICEEYLEGRYKLEVIDIYQHPEMVLPENIVAIPTLIKKLPPPLQRLVGDMSNTEKVLVGLDVVPPKSRNADN